MESIFLEKKVYNLAGSLKERLKELALILERVTKADSLQEKSALLDEESKVGQFFSRHPKFLGLQVFLSEKERYLFKVLVVIDQAEHIVQYSKTEQKSHITHLVNLLNALIPVEEFYHQMGGVLGYHYTSLQLLQELQEEAKVVTQESFYPPVGVDLTQDSRYVRESILEGILHLGEMAELYPVGGAADRLKLQDEKTHEGLPAARLEFLGYTLLEGMIRDLQAREYLHFRLVGQQLVTPVALMTSYEKHNHELVQEILEQAHYFGRPSSAFKLFAQPSVPTFTEEGLWCLKGPMELLLKPGGHGVIWKLAKQEKVLEWFLSQKRSKILVRQINNPIAGTDHGLLALFGIGCKEKKAFGFASCARRVKTNEGMNVLKQKVQAEGICIALSNVEYCDFKKRGIQDVPLRAGEPYSIFPSNTNILFADILEVSHAVDLLPYPGKLVNLKPMQFFFPGGESREAPVARLELLMQNIADAFEVQVEKPLEEEARSNLPTFITFNKRCKTISPTKKEFVPEAGLVETALGCFYDYLKNCRELFTEECLFSLPSLCQEELFLKEGPSFLIRYHPALGPLYSIIGQKIRKGSLSDGSELQLEIAEVDIAHLQVEGSLIVEAKQIMGHYEDGCLRYSHRVGRLYLNHVVIKNKGIDREEENVFWKNSIARREKCFIHLEGDSEFRAENITLEGDITIVVKDKERVTALMQGGELVLIHESLDERPPYKAYTIDNERHICLIT